MKSRFATIAPPLVVLLCSLPVVWASTRDAKTPYQAASAGLTLLLLGVVPAVIATTYAPIARFPSSTLIRYGQSRRSLALRQTIRISVLSLVATFCGCALVLLLAYESRRDLLADFAQTAPITISATLALVGSFAFARSWGGKIGVVFLLLFFWIAAPHTAAWGQGLPTTHIRQLIGVGENLSAPGWRSHATLAAIALGTTLLSLLRVPR